MATTVRTQIEQQLSSHRRRVIFAGILSLVALFVAYEVVLHLRQRGFTMVREVTVLDCPYDGNGAHTHDTSCYDEEGNLVCPLEERELHVHDDSCYTEEQVLACGMEESEGHTHTEECYDEEGNLTCELEESEGHQHTDGCYEVVRTLTCEQEEVTETHTHGPGCFKTILVDDGQEEEDATESAMGGEQTFTQDLAEQDVFSNEQLALSVMVKAPVGSLPPESSLVVTPLEGDQILQRWEGVDDLISRELGGNVVARRVASARLELVDAQGQRVAPVGNVQVKAWTDFVRDAREVVVIRLADGDDPERTEPELMYGTWLVNWDEEASGSEDALQFWMDGPVMAFAVVELGVAPAPDELVVQPEDQQAEESEEQQEGQPSEEQQEEQQFEEQQEGQQSEEQQEEQPDQPEGEQTDKGADQTEGEQPEQTEEQPEGQQPEQTEDQQTDQIAEQPEGQQPEEQEGQQSDRQPEQPADQREDGQDEQETSGPQLIEHIVDIGTQALYPARDFEGRAGNMLVVVKAPEGAFPAGTTMKVELVDNDEIKDAVTSAVSGMVETVAAVDITFYDADGEEVQPLVPIQVTMTTDGALDDGQPIVLQMDEEGEASVVAQAPISNSHNEVNFDVVPMTV